MTKTLAEISEAMKDIDFCMLVSRAEDGSLGGRPMSNNREVEFEGTSRFFTCDHHRSVADIERDPSVGLSYQGKAGLLGIVGKPGMFVQSRARPASCATRRSSPSTGRRASTCGSSRASTRPAS